MFVGSKLLKLKVYM